LCTVSGLFIVYGWNSIAHFPLDEPIGPDLAEEEYDQTQEDAHDFQSLVVGDVLHHVIADDVGTCMGQFTDAVALQNAIQAVKQFLHEAQPLLDLNAFVLVILQS